MNLRGPFGTPFQIIWFETGGPEKNVKRKIRTRRTDGRTVGWTDGQTDRRTDGRTLCRKIFDVKHFDVNLNDKKIWRQQVLTSTSFDVKHF